MYELHCALSKKRCHEKYKSNMYSLSTSIKLESYFVTTSCEHEQSVQTAELTMYYQFNELITKFSSNIFNGSKTAKNVVLVTTIIAATVKYR